MKSGASCQLAQVYATIHKRLRVNTKRTSRWGGPE